MNDCILDEAVCEERACFRETALRYDSGRRTGLKNHRPNFFSINARGLLLPGTPIKWFALCLIWVDERE